MWRTALPDAAGKFLCRLCAEAGKEKLLSRRDKLKAQILKQHRGAAGTAKRRFVDMMRAGQDGEDAAAWDGGRQTAARTADGDAADIDGHSDEDELRTPSARLLAGRQVGADCPHGPDASMLPHLGLGDSSGTDTRELHSRVEAIVRAVRTAIPNAEDIDENEPRAANCERVAVGSATEPVEVRT